MDDLFKKIQKNLFAGNVAQVSENVNEGLKKGFSVSDILNKALLSGMELVGKDFKENKIFIPEVLIAAKAVHAGLNILEPHFEKEGIEHKGKVLMGTVKGDLHDIGKNIVSMMLRGAGFEIFDLGVDVPKEKFVLEIKDKNIDIVGMSCLITTALVSIKETIKHFENEGIRDNIKIMVGGAAVTNSYAESIGADAYGDDASDSVTIVNKFIKNGTSSV